MNPGAILDRVFQSHWTLVAAVVVLIVVLFILYKFGMAFFGGSSKFAGQLLALLRSLYREAVGGPHVAGYERLNGLLIVILGGVTLVLLAVVIGQSISGLLGGSPGPALIAALLFVVVVTAATGIVCVRAVARHQDDGSAAKKLRQG